MGMKDMAAGLAALDEDTRRTMLETRLQGFAAMPYEERVRAMAEMLGGIHGLSDADHRALVASRIWALSQLPHETQVTLMRAHLAALVSLQPEQRQRENEAVQAGVAGLSDDARKKLLAAMQEAQAQ
jgi:hypothetical protein